MDGRQAASCEPNSWVRARPGTGWLEQQAVKCGMRERLETLATR